MEKWKQIGDWPYEVSDLGRVRRSEGASGTRAGRTLRPRKQHDGYLRLQLCDAPRSKQFLVHRLVAEAFIPNPHHKPVVNHIDGDKGNPRADNLEWVTQEENQLHAAQLHGHYGSGNGRAKLADEDVLEIRRRYTGKWGQQRQLGLEFGVSQMLVSKIVSGACWTHLPLGECRGSPKKTQGAAHSRAKLTDRQVRAIRRRYEGGATTEELAETFMVARSIVRDIVRRKTWRHIE